MEKVLSQSWRDGSDGCAWTDSPIGKTNTINKRRTKFGKVITRLSEGNEVKKNNKEQQGFAQKEPAVDTDGRRGETSLPPKV
jgi:hypothetical protein